MEMRNMLESPLKQSLWGVSLSQRHIGWISPIFPTPFSFSALVQRDPFRTYGKALRFLKLESFRQPTVKTW